VLGERVGHFTRLGPAAFPLLREEEPSVCDHVELAPLALCDGGLVPDPA